jgi:hypothetical protein
MSKQTRDTVELVKSRQVSPESSSANRSPPLPSPFSPIVITSLRRRRCAVVHVW